MRPGGHGVADTAGCRISRAARAGLVAAFVVAFVAVLGGALPGRAPGAPAVARPPLTASAAAPAAASGTAPVDPQYPFAGYLQSTVTGITPTVVTAGAGDVLTMTGTVTNASQATIYDLRYVFQRSDPLAGLEAVKSEIATPSRPTAVVGQAWRTLTPAKTSAATAAGKPVDLAAGASMSFTATVAIGNADGLAIDRRGIYAVMLKVAGDIGQEGRIQYERVGEAHFLSTVLAVPAAAPPVAALGSSPAAATGTGDSAADTATAGPTAVAPVTDIPESGFPTTSATSSSSTGTAAPSTSRPAPTSVPTLTATPTPTLTPTPTPGTPNAPTAGNRPVKVPVNLLWPLVDKPHLGVGGVFLNDELAKELVPGGRLYGVVTNLIKADPLGSMSTVVVDPALLHEVQQMSTGYRVVSVPGRPQAALTPTTPPTAAPAAGSGSHTVPTADPHSTTTTPPASTGSNSAAASDSSTSSGPTLPASGAPGSTGKAAKAGTTAPAKTPAGTVAGTGRRAAEDFLALLRSALAGRQVLVLPYSDPDAVAMVRAGLSDQLATLVTSGRSVAARVLQLDPARTPDRPGLITGLALPENGLIDDATLEFWTAHGMSKAILAPGGVRHAGGAVGAVRIAAGGRTVQAALTDSSMTAAVNDLIRKGRAPGLAMRLTNLAALLTGSSIDGTGTPLVLAPANRWNPNGASWAILTGLLDTLQTGAVVRPTPLTTIADGRATSATLTYPASARQAELDQALLREVADKQRRIASLTASLSRARGVDTPIPSDLLEPLSAALLPLGSAGLQTDETIARSILDTTGTTLAGLQSAVTLAAGSPSYTLASSTSPLQISVRNDTPYVVRMRVKVDGSAVGMKADDPGVQEIPAGRSHQFKVDTQVVRAGRFVARVQLLAADGTPWSEPTAITVTSSAYGTLTIVLIAVAGGALFLMVALRLVQRVRGRDKNDPDAGRFPSRAESGSSGSSGSERSEGSEGSEGLGPSILSQLSQPDPDSILAAANAPPGGNQAVPDTSGSQGPPDAAPDSTAPSDAETGENER